MREEMQEIGAPGENLCMVFGRPPEAFFSHGVYRLALYKKTVTVTHNKFYQNFHLWKIFLSSILLQFWTLMYISTL